MDSLSHALQWHTTLKYLISPPEGYLMPAVDLMSEINEIVRKLVNEEYENEVRMRH